MPKMNIEAPVSVGDKVYYFSVLIRKSAKIRNCLNTEELFNEGRRIKS